jgi:hypothetical protein
MTLLRNAISDPRNGWSIGTFGAIGEFVQDMDEADTAQKDANVWDRITPRSRIFRMSRI